MSEYIQFRRKPQEISRSMASVIRRLKALEDSLVLEIMPQELIDPVWLAIEHVRFLQADLSKELADFNAKYKIPPSISQ